MARWLRFGTRLSMTGRSLSDEAHRLAALRRIEDEILRQTKNEVEFFLLLDFAGEPLFGRLGGRNVSGDRVLHGVPLRRSELRRYIGGTYLFTHNHPTRSSFTPQDVSAMIYLNVREGNAFDERTRYRLIRLGDAWPGESAVLQEIAALETEVFALQAASLRSRRITPMDAAVTHYDLLWTLFVRRHADEIAYVREAR